MSVVTALRLGVKMLKRFSVLSNPAMLLEREPGVEAEKVRRREQTRQSFLQDWKAKRRSAQGN